MATHDTVDARPSSGQPSRLSVLWDFARPHKWTLALALVLGLGVSAAELATPLVTRWILDAIGAGSGSVVGPVTLLAGLIMVGTILSWRQWMVLGTMAEDVVYDARQGMVRRFLHARVIPMVARPTGESVTRITSDTVLLREATSSSAVGLVNGTITVIGTLVLMMYLHPVLGGFFIAAVALIGVLFATMMPAIAQAQEDAQKSLGRLGGSLETTLRAIKTVKIAAAESRQSDAVLTWAADSRQHSLRAVRREAAVWSLTFSGIQAATLALVCAGAYLVSTGQMSMSTLVAFLLYAVGLLGPAMEISSHLTTLQAGVAAAGRIRDVRSLPVENVDKTATLDVSQDVISPVVSIEGVSARYRNRAPVLENVSLDIPRHGHTAIVGPSGAGKTTLFALMLKFIEPQTGRVLMAGAPYSDLGMAQVRRRLQYVEQDSPLLPGSLRDNLIFANPSASQRDIDEVLHRLRLTEFVDGLDSGLDTDVAAATISGGQRQRIALARALLAEHDVLLLDEVTAQVDGLSEAAIHQVIDDHAECRAVVTIAHRLSTVISADNIIVMDRGHIVDRGRHPELLSRCSLYRRLVEALSLTATPQRDASALDLISAEGHARP